MGPCSGALTTVLLLDDFFLLHDAVLPRLGFPEEVVYSLYGLAVMAYVVRFAKGLAGPERMLLFLSLGWFAISIALDLVPFHSPGKFFVEDALKFLGIMTWATHVARVCFHECSLLMEEQPSRRSPGRSEAGSSPRDRALFALPSGSATPVASPPHPS